MRLLLIRHGETVHNVAGVYAGVTDSALTNHGVLQANRLGSHLAATNIKIAHVFSSDLRRAYLTAEAIREPQVSEPPPTTKLELLREQDFGYYEGKHFTERPKESYTSKDTARDSHRDEPGFKDIESKESMQLRMNSFIDEHLLQLLHRTDQEHTIAVVAHGIILSHLWRTFMKRFRPGNILVTPVVQTATSGFSLEHLGMWSNTGYLDLEIKTPESKVASVPEPSIVVETPALEVDSTSEPPASDISTPLTSRLLNLLLVVRAINSQEHLRGLKKTRGGIGSLKYDSSQTTMDSFFKKRKLG